MSTTKEGQQSHINNVCGVSYQSFVMLHYNYNIHMHVNSYAVLYLEELCIQWTKIAAYGF